MNIEIICIGLKLLVKGLLDWFIGIICIDLLFDFNELVCVGVVYVIFELGVCMVWYIYLFG